MNTHNDLSVHCRELSEQGRELSEHCRELSEPGRAALPAGRRPGLLRLRQHLAAMLLATLPVFLAPAPASAAAQTADEAVMSTIAREYVTLSLAMTPHDGAFVDAYYGPAALKARVEAEPLALAAIRERSNRLARQLAALPSPAAGSDEALRLEYLRKQVRAMQARIDMIAGKRYSFDEETALLYDAVSPKLSREHFLALHKEIEQLLPGEGPLVARINAFRAQFIIPKDRLRAVFDAAIQGCRERTLKHVQLPAGEGFTLEFVTGKPWSGYNWYQGKFRSLIQVNIEQPIFIERAIDLGCHEGYPGHHTYNALLEKNLVNEKGWLEFSVYPLWSPQSLIAEGSANYGVDIAFPEAERMTFQREVLYPLAGLDASKAEQYDQLLKLLGKLSYAGNEAARDYIDGRITREQAQDWLINVELYPAVKAAQRTQFFDVNRGYVINYNLGKDMVKNWVEKQAAQQAGVPAEQARWQVFKQLLSSPRLPGGLQ